MPEIRDFPQHFMDYRWDNKHQLFGYPPDRYQEFHWIASLEARFSWLRANHALNSTTSIYLLKEMIQWGGSQNGVLQKFEDGLGEVNLYNIVGETIRSLGTPCDAIASALKLPGMGLTYASKLLRFLDPERYGALDSRLRKGLTARAADAQVPKIYDSDDSSIIKGYLAFLSYIDRLKAALQSNGIPRPPCKLTLARESAWRAADIEMALFKWAEADNEA